MKKTLPPLLTAIVIAALATSSHGQLLSDDFESYTVDTELNTSGPWSYTNSEEGFLTVRDESTATPFVVPTQYLDYNDISDPGNPSMSVRSPNIAAASGAVTTYSFDFNEPTSAADGPLAFGYTMENGDHTSSQGRLLLYLDDGLITNLSTTSSNTYSLDTAYRLYVVFNDTAATVNYPGGSVAPQVADVWIHPLGGPLVFAGTRTASNTQTASYKVGFRSYTSVVQQVLLDAVLLEDGVVLPDGNPPTLDTKVPADDDTGVMLNPTLTATFDRRVLPGTGNITINKVSDDSTVATFDVTDPADVAFDGPSITFSPSSALDLNTEYYVLIPSTAVESTVGVAYAGISATTEWSFTTTSDATPPTISGKTPNDDATAVPVDSDLVATFDEPISAASGNITITNLTESSTFATIDINDGTQVTVDGSTVTINPSSDLREGRSYAVEIDSGSVTDAFGNLFGGLSGTTDWNFATVPDTTDPTLVSTTPGDDTTLQSPFNNLLAKFDEAVQAGTGNITIKDLTNSGTFATIPIGDAQVSISGDTVTINPTSDLDPATDYAIQIDATAIDDLSGNPFAGVLDDTTWNFFTTRLSSRDHILGDRQAEADPSGYYPESSSNLVGTGGPTNGHYSRNVVLGMTLPTLPVGETVGAAEFSFEITAARDSTGAGNLPDLQVYLLDTANPDASGTSFFYHGPGDPSTDVELAYTTSVTISGTGENTFPDDAEDRVVRLTGDALTLFLSFYGGDNIPDQPEAFFRFNLDEVLDLSSYRRYRIDVASAEVDIQVTGVPATPPVLASTVPADNATTVSQVANLMATFDQPIVAGSGNITIKNLTDSTTFATIPVGDGQVSISGSVLKIDPTSDLDADKEYAVQLDAGVVHDLLGQGNAAVSHDSTWNFMTGFSGAKASSDSIRGRAQSASLVYLVDSTAGGRVGIGGSSGSREDYNQVFGFTLPTLPVGETISGANLDFEIIQTRDNGADPALHVYLLDTTDPDSSGISFFYHGASDSNTDVAFVGATNLPDTGNTLYDDDVQDQTFAITGDALTLLESFYGGDNIPERTEVFFRFNLDQLLGNATLNNFDRYFIDTASAESSLTIASTTVGGSSYDSWASANGLIGGDALPTADIEGGTGDGLDNLLEFGFGTDPNVSYTGPLVWDGVNLTPGQPIAKESLGAVKAQFVRRTDHGTSGSVRYRMEFSPDIVTWETSDENPTWVPTSIGSDPSLPGYELVQFAFPGTLPVSGQEARFFRVTVIEVP